jgi:hypothetical protein
MLGSTAHRDDVEMAPLGRSGFALLSGTDQAQQHDRVDRAALKMPHFSVSRRCWMLILCNAFLAFVWTLVTFVLTLKNSTCWTVRDELNLLNNFNTLSAEFVEGPLPLRNACVRPAAVRACGSLTQRASHSHNDYLQPMPLYEALSAGFCSVEGDVHLLSSVLRLGHAIAGTATLEDMYVKPLATLAIRNGGTVFKRAMRLGACLQVTLLVDFKSVDKVATWEALEGLLELVEGQNAGGLADGRPIFATYDQEGQPVLPLTSGLVSPVRVVATGLGGNTSGLVALMKARPVHRTVLDLSSPPPAGDETLKYTGMISVTWPFSWPPADDAAKAAVRASLLQRVREAKRVGPQCTVRYWNTPEDPALWEMLLAAGVDMINTDRIFTLHAYLTGRSAVNTLD